jgi:hypothetical protein
MMWGDSSEGAARRAVAVVSLTKRETVLRWVFFDAVHSYTGGAAQGTHWGGLRAVAMFGR